MAGSSWMIRIPSTILRLDLERVGERGDRDVERGAGQHPVALGRGVAVDLDHALRDQVGRAGARDPEELGDRGVDALAGQRLGHLEAAVVGALSHRRARRSRTRDPSSLMPRNAWMRISPAATLMHMSATLKIGQCGSIRKSMTWPRKRARRAEHPVGEVAGHPGEQEAERHGPGRAAEPAAQPEHDADGDDRDAGEHLGERGAGAERRTRVAGQVQLQQVADQRLVRLAGQVLDGEVLGDLVDDVEQRGGEGEHPHEAPTYGSLRRLC